MNKLLKDILLGIFAALFFSAFIYLEHFGITNKLLNSLLGLIGIAMFLYIPRRAILFASFSVGILWFYWIGYSFKYQGVGYMAPVVTLGFGIVYLLFFLPLYFTDKPYIRAILLFLLSFIEPFDWSWMKPELLFVDSYFGVYKYQLVALLGALSLPSLLKKQYKYLPLLLLIVTVNYGYPKQSNAPLKIKLIQTDIKQDEKWKSSNLYATIAMIFNDISHAREQGYDVVIFPESVIPLFLNKNPLLIAELLQASKDITIIAGSLINDNGHDYNVTYMFNNGKYQIAKKTILVPFGEYIPLPKFMQHFINDTFFKGASDFLTAKNPTDFMIKGVKFRNAICYEATCEKLYQGDVKYLIATSNNAWFTPSIEPTIQHILLKYYAKKYGVTIYHSTNDIGTGIISP